MANITDQRAITFSNQVVRVLCERVRALKQDIDAGLNIWNNGVVSGLFPNDAGSPLIDGRAGGEGIQNLTGADVNSVMSVLTTMQTQLNGAGVATVIQKPCVRPLGGN